MRIKDQGMKRTKYSKRVLSDEYCVPLDEYCVPLDEYCVPLDEYCVPLDLFCLSVVAL